MNTRSVPARAAGRGIGRIDQHQDRRVPQVVEVVAAGDEAHRVAVVAQDHGPPVGREGKLDDPGPAVVLRYRRPIPQRSRGDHLPIGGKDRLAAIVSVAEPLRADTEDRPRRQVRLTPHDLKTELNPQLLSPQ